MTSSINVVDQLMSAAATRGDKVALREGDRSWTYTEVHDRVLACAERLRASGVKPGDRVLLVMPTSAEFVFVHHGALMLGAIVVPVNPMCTAREIGYFVTDARCAAAVVWDATSESTLAADELHDLPVWVLGPGDLDVEVGVAASRRRPVMPSVDAAVILYTSGTTGRPKGAVLTHANIVAAAHALRVALNASEDDRFGTALPLFHVFGQVAVMGVAFDAQACLSLLRPFSAEAMLRMAADHRLTVASGVPTMWNEVLRSTMDESSLDLSALRVVTSGGASLPGEVLRAFQRRFGAALLEGYGLSETAAAATFNVPEGRRMPGSVGPALPGIQLEVRSPAGQKVPTGEVGEIAIRGPVVMAGYWNQPEATAAVMRDGWFLTGDLGRLDKAGDLRIVDRTKDLIIRGGYNVYPREVEEVLYEHPAVREAAVVGVPDDRLGEEVMAVIAVVDGMELSAEHLRPWLAERLAAYKLPRLYSVVPALPKGPTGKILKRALDRDALAAASARVRYRP